MSFSGKYVPISVVLDRLKMQANLSIAEEDAAEWLADFMTKIVPYDLLETIVTDGNIVTGSPEPVVVQDYRAQLPCNIVYLMHVIDSRTFIQLRESDSPMNLINFENNAHFPDLHDKVPSNLGKSPDQFQIRNGFVFTDFKDGHLILVYKGWPLSADGEFQVPGDRPFLDAMTWTLQEKIDYLLWRTGEIAESVYKHTMQSAQYARGYAVSYGNTSRDGEAYTQTNIWNTALTQSNYFRTAYQSLGRQIVQRTH